MAFVLFRFAKLCIKPFDANVPFLGSFFCIAFCSFRYRQGRSPPVANALLFQKRKTCFGRKMRCLLREALKEFWNVVLHFRVSTKRWKLNGRHAKTSSITVLSRCRNRLYHVTDCSINLRQTCSYRYFTTLRSLATMSSSSSVVAMFDGIGWKRRFTAMSKQILASSRLRGEE